MKIRVESILEKIIYSIAFLVIFYIFSINTNYIFSSICTIITAAIGFFIKHKLKINQEVDTIKQSKLSIGIDKYFIIFLFIFALILRIASFKILNIQPYSDYETILEAAQKLLIGENILNTCDYFKIWPYQTGIVLYQTAILAVFKSVNAIHYLNCIYASISCCFIYLIAKELFSNRAAKIVSLLYTITMFTVTFTSIMSNQHLSSMLILIAFYIAISSKLKIKPILKFVIIGAILAISDIIRNEAILYILVFICFFIVKMKNKQTIKQGIQGIIICVTVFLVIVKLSSLIIVTTNINQYGLKNNDMLWKFVCGTNVKTNGQYISKAKDIIGKREEEIQFIKNNFKKHSAKEYVQLVDDKQKIFWQKKEYIWGEKSKGYEKQKETILQYDNIVYGTVLVLTNIYMIYSLFKKNKNVNATIILLSILANFFVYILIEVQPRYSYLAKMMLYIMAAGGIEVIFSKIEQIYKMRIERGERK